jgi:ferredoxin--NADP+ reductase
MLALTEEELRETDTADHAIDDLAENGIEEIVVLGRRGPAQAAFTNPELRELGEMKQADIVVDEAEIELDELSSAYLESDDADITTRKNVEILREFAQKPLEGRPKRIILRFLRSPIELQGDGRLEKVVVGRNELVAREDGSLRANDTGDREELECGLLLRSVGYTGIGVEGVAFDESRGTLLNADGRVLEGEGGGHRAGHYTSGWIKRGPSGVIGTNKKCAQETVSHLLSDAEAGKLHDPEAPEPDAIEDLLREREVDFVTFAGWQAIDAAEVARGEPQGRPRVKFVRVEEMLVAARDSVAG